MEEKGKRNQKKHGPPPKNREKKNKEFPKNKDREVTRHPPTPGLF